MTTSAVDNLLSAASGLPSSDLDLLLSKLQALRSVTKKGEAKNEQELHSQLLYHALSSHLLSQLHIPPIPESIFFNKASLKGLNKQVKEGLALAVEQLNTLAPEMTRTEWASVADLVAGLAVERVKNGQFEMPWQGIALMLKNLPQLLDTHFPGYASSNLLKLVLKLRVQKRTPSHVRHQSIEEARK